MDGGRLRPIALSEFDAQPLISQPCPSRNADAPACITVSDAYCRYERTSDWVLRGFDLRVAQGSIHALIGGNGCGKSTLLRVIAGVQKLDRGACVNVLAQRQALLPQDPKGLFVCDTVQEELAEWQHACGYADADVDAIAQAFGLAERLSNHPYDLSGGQQQLLALAKLLLTKPSLLLLDEPMKGLNPQTKCQVAKAIQGQARAGVTVVMATHDLPFAALVADEATMLFDGESAATQPAPDFFADNLFYRPTRDSFAKQWLENEAD
ncbi:MAG: ATP-binding cassette domain-containing protein [Senegalimassilia anaerobia]